MNSVHKNLSLYQCNSFKFFSITENVKIMRSFLFLIYEMKEIPYKIIILRTVLRKLLKNLS